MTATRPLFLGPGTAEDAWPLPPTEITGTELGPGRAVDAWPLPATEITGPELGPGTAVPTVMTATFRGPVIGTEALA